MRSTTSACVCGAVSASRATTREAERLYSAAAQQGHRSAQLALGGLKAERARTNAEWAEVAHWYRLAADAGHPAAMASLAQLYERGRGVAERSCRGTDALSAGVERGASPMPQRKCGASRLS